MKLILATIAVIGSCMLFIAGSSGEEANAIANAIPVDADENFQNARIFFNTGDPCNNFIYRFLNITDAKCSLQCYIQGGLQQGGYCDDDNVCQCNQIQ